MGISAVRRMHALSGKPDASDEMCRLIVLNTASIQLIPSTVGAVRASLGSARPFDILPAVWLTSACSVTAGLLAARLSAGGGAHDRADRSVSALRGRLLRAV